MTSLSALRCSVRLSTTRGFASSSRCLNAASTSTYSPPLKPGQLAAYDEAVAFIAKDREEKLKLIEELRAKGEEDQDKLDEIETEAWVRDRETRWRARNGLGEWLLWDGFCFWMLMRLCSRHVQACVSETCGGCLAERRKTRNFGD
jgi:hypothetical protein